MHNIQYLYKLIILEAHLRQEHMYKSFDSRLFFLNPLTNLARQVGRGYDSLEVVSTLSTGL